MGIAPRCEGRSDINILNIPSNYHNHIGDQNPRKELAKSLVESLLEIRSILEASHARTKTVLDRNLELSRSFQPVAHPPEDTSSETE